MKKDIAFGGVTRLPGGALSSDGDLCAAVDVCNDGMGVEMLEKPMVLFTLRNEDDTEHHLRYTEELLCIHEPEGEDKHYITQMVVAGIQAAPSQPQEGAGAPSQDPEPSEDPDPVTPAEPIEPFDPEPAIVVPDEPEEQDSSNPRPTVDPYLPPDIPIDAETVYDEAVRKERFERETDDGGTVFFPPGGGGSEEPPVEEGIYLVWRADNGDGTSTIRQMIDITAYGRVTAIQPMGNTLVCNHAGGTSTITETWLGQTTTTEVSNPPAVRYYIFKKEQDGDPLNHYLPLGSRPPFLKIRFGLKSKFEWWPKTESTLKPNDAGYAKYGGVESSSYAYSDTVAVYYGDYVSESYVPPHELVPEDVLKHWSGTYSIENVTSPDGKTDVAGMKVNWTTMALACYNKFISEQQKDNKFVFPFFVRYAYELYDGSLIMHSYPVLMIPNSRGPIFALDGKYGLLADRDDEGHSYEKVHLQFMGRTYAFTSRLMHQITALTQEEYTRLENWKDLIRGISIYVTPPMYNYKQGGQVLGWHSMSSQDPANSNEDPWKRYYTVGKVVYGANDSSSINGEVMMSYAFANMIGSSMSETVKVFWPYNNTYKTPSYCMTIPQKDDKEITEMHESAGQFFKLATIDFDELLKYAKNGLVDAEVEIRNKILNTISNQDVMTDDNGSHDTLSADVLYGYNRRLNMAHVSRVMHSPLPLATQWAHDYTSGHAYNEIVYANNGGGRCELITAGSGMGVTWPKFIFYPGTDAREVVLYRDGTSVKYRIKLKEHKALNGMFWIADFTNKADSITDFLSTKVMTYPTDEKNKTVDESNKIYTSETDNPFVVPIGNINIAGGGEVRALCAATQAMSQGQFGQHPMYTFTSEGVWAMTVGESGGWATIQPVTRDVISEGTKPLSLDSTVVFLTERGLLQLGGSDVKVLSDVLQGADPLVLESPSFGLRRLEALCAVTGTSPLLGVSSSLAGGKFPERAWLTYDYDNARIYVTPQDGGGSWVYNLKSGLWTQASAALDNQVVSYPECEAQCGGKVVRISVDRALQGNLREKGLVISRPIKIADMGLLKRWREVAVRGRFKPYSTAVQVALWGTRDWLDFALVGSSTRNRLTRWSGSPYFGHSVALFLTRPGYAMQVAGMDVEVDAEHDNKLR